MAEDGAQARNIPGLTPARQRRIRTVFRLLTALSPALSARCAARLFITPRTRRISDQDAAFLATAASRRLSTPHGAVQIYEWPGTGPAVLVLHGWISYAGQLRSIIEGLLAHGLRVVAFDAPAHGRSGGRQADLPSFRDALAAVGSACAPAGAILAHSFGAITAASWLAEDAAAAHLRAAVLVGLPRDIGYLFESFTMAMGLRADVIQRLRALFRARYGGDPEDYSAPALARRIHIPVLLVHGGADEYIPAAHAQEVALQLRDGHIQVIAGLNHSAPLRDPHTIELMARFISERLQG
ncbi:MAG TPA: alpha/beta fold hydrolase [Steroidobacteraceae bacterium]|jgi:alpha-beta hydrolase superfamily lysophospholipase|nr:alpha/beta fold hydrolase [Steroidobacteraceae bacterium]